MAEREAEVRSRRGDELGLALLGSACEGCAGGCRGRCNLFATGQDGVFHLVVPHAADYAPGQRLRLSLDDEALRRAAWRGYGVALLGLLLGAAAGHGLGRALDGPADLFALIGLALGTFLAARFSKPTLPEPRVERAGSELSPEISRSDRP
ncbi:MAG: SoxR reducing system RseC family protein [Rhizobium sp.]|nr:SoxR reducing system RseC family protein [Rhizobium sp.]